MKNAQHPANHAIAHAALKAEEKKARFVPKGTLSLAGSHNKRSGDADSMPQAAEAASQALAVAAQSLHDNGGIKEREVATKQGVEAKPAQSAPIDLSDIPRVVFRQDVRGNVFCFMVDTMDVEKNTIIMYDLSRDGEKEEVPVDFYRTLKPAEQKAKDRASAKMIEKLGVARLITRDRLLKSHMLERDTEGKVDAKGIEDLKEALLKAVEQFRQAILSA